MDLKSFGKKLRRFRQKAGLSQQVLADRVPVSMPLLSRWENGHKKPGRQSVIRLIEIFSGQQRPGEAWEWAAQAGHELSRQDLQDLFPLAEVHLPAPSRPKPAHHPSLPAYYVERPDLETKIVAALSPEGTEKALVLFGPGGSGKTTLAAWAAEKLSSDYPDGLVWVEYDTVLNAQHRIADSLGVRLTGTSLAERAGELRSLLRKKRCLIVLDDVWAHRDLAYLKVHNSTSSLLVTGRDKSLAQIFETSASLGLAGLSSKEGVDLLRKLGGSALEADDSQQLVDCVEGLPLALILIGAQLQNGYTPTELLNALQERPADLAILDIGPPQTRRRSLGRCFEISYRNLPERKLQKRFAQLGCFISEFGSKMAGAVWGLNPDEARYILGQLNRFMLVTQDDQSYWLHPLLRDYARLCLVADWPEEAPSTYARHAAFYIRHCLYHPQILGDAEEVAINLELCWDDVIAGVKWATTHRPNLAAQAVLLAHTERGALLEAVGLALIEATEKYCEQIPDRAEQALLYELLGDLQLLLNERNEAGLAYFEAASQLWQKLEDGLAASQARLRLAGAYLLQQEQKAAAEEVRQAQTLFEESLPLADSETIRAERLFYWFNMIYNPLVRWERLPEADVANLVTLANKTGHIPLRARALSIYQLWCTTRAVTRPPEIRQRGLELAQEAAALWEACGRRDRAEDEISFAQYRLTNQYDQQTAANFARRRLATTPQIGPNQTDLFKNKNPALHWWLKAKVKDVDIEIRNRRIDWLSWMLPRYLKVDNCPRQPKTNIELPILKPGTLGYQWVEAILNIGMLGGTGRRIMMEKEPPDDHILNGPEWRVLSGQRAFPLAGEAAKRVVKRYLHELEEMLSEGSE